MNNKISDVVLVVDDSPESLGMLNVALNTEGYTPLVALNGVQAISIAEKVTPDVVLLDAVMPEMNGFETCKRLRQILPNTPIIFMTGLSDVEDIVNGFEAGGIDYVTKPISPDEVIVRIKTHIHTAKLALSAQNALDHAGSNVLCVNDNGCLSWATPFVYELIDSISKFDSTPWVTLSNALKDWLLEASENRTSLDLRCFDSPLTLSYQRKQGELHLLKISKAKEKKTAEVLKARLPITQRESEVLYWLSYGKTSWEISQILELSPRTVNKHLEQIYKKLGVDNRTSAAAISIRLLEE
ncbi:response regulator transcription factor [Pseudoalteromonas phenolica]|uniref:LuxR family transcriptional regulator n=1 Tax=Pseudoalteromonas phenolica TaxID=161398 RepID=A0A0S2K8U8_9GAMM|nr:DNA-binding response regulator [Pseudoalteromonas phenolica]ALO44467.1 LuxR family transcriptional regulator [Pseudoalteromonas phenolica]MBE0357486.1 hypothetical protein [Pseudoalteromonas phenolica O-BC30]RXF07221.1 response regulator [Pseudoalteromonas phenolica O-BC30]